MATDHRATDHSARYRLDGEQRARVLDCLRKAGISLGSAEFETFISEVEASISQLQANELEGSFRGAHNGMRDL